MPTAASAPASPSPSDSFSNARKSDQTTNSITEDPYSNLNEIDSCP